MTNEDMKKVAIKASVFALVSITLMLHRSATKHIMITDAAGAPVDRVSSESSYSLLVDQGVPEGKENTLIIPLPKSVSSDNIILEDGYMDHELRIYIDSRDEGFYKDNPVVTDLDILESAVCINQNDTGSVCLDFKTDQLYVNESSLTESSTIEVKFFRPSEKYEHIVVVDPRAIESAGGDATDPSSEKDVILDTALLLKGIADKDQENNVKVYLTRLSDAEADREKRLALVEDSQADLFVELSLEGTADQGKSGISAYYNDKYFIRRLNNGQFGDIMLRNCAVKTGTEALGVVPLASDEDILAKSRIPSTRIDLGNVSSSEEGDRLSEEVYRKRLSEGIYSGILEAFEVME